MPLMELMNTDPMENTRDMKRRVHDLMARVHLELFEHNFDLHVKQDRKDPRIGGRVYIQLVYTALDHELGVHKGQKARKWYLSEHMTDDEILKTAYAAFRMAVQHEVVEGFTVDGVRVFDPHRPIEALLGLNEVVRREKEPKKVDSPSSPVLKQLHHITESLGTEIALTLALREKQTPPLTPALAADDLDNDPS